MGRELAWDSMTVTVDGRELVLNPFVERILVSGIRGLLSELKGFGPGAISIRIGSCRASGGKVCVAVTTGVLQSWGQVYFPFELLEKSIPLHNFDLQKLVL